MRTRTLILATVLSLLPASAAFAQETSLPASCRSSEPMKMDNMKMDDASMQGMDDAHRAYMQAMMKMHPAMMQGISAKDPDVAFVCGMIAHHQGAIDMAEVELKFGKDEDARGKAQKVIDAQKKEIEEFSQWVDSHAQ